MAGNHIQDAGQEKEQWEGAHEAVLADEMVHDEQGKETHYSGYALIHFCGDDGFAHAYVKN